MDWLDVFSRQACMDKVDAILEQVAYPNEIFNDSYLDDLYADVSWRHYRCMWFIILFLDFKMQYNITLNDFFDNGYRILRTTLESQLSKLRKPVQRGRWPTEASPITTNAYYSPNQNQFGKLFFINWLVFIPIMFWFLNLTFWSWTSLSCWYSTNTSVQCWLAKVSGYNLKNLIVTYHYDKALIH